MPSPYTIQLKVPYFALTKLTKVTLQKTQICPVPTHQRKSTAASTKNQDLQSAELAPQTMSYSKNTRISYIEIEHDQGFHSLIHIVDIAVIPPYLFYIN